VSEAIRRPTAGMSAKRQAAEGGAAALVSYLKYILLPELQSADPDPRLLAMIE
jgi:hypothetical protein